MNATVIEHGVNGLLAHTPDEWRTAILTLAGDPALRARLGGAGRRLIEERYSRNAIVRRMADALVSASRHG